MHDLGISTYPQGLKQECDILQRRGITFSWREIECEPSNGVLLGYEIKLYYDDQMCTVRVGESVTTFTIEPHWRLRPYFPKAISVAAINEVGVGDYCPPVNINQSG